MSSWGSNEWIIVLVLSGILFKGFPKTVARNGLGYDPVQGVTGEVFGFGKGWGAGCKPGFWVAELAPLGDEEVVVEVFSYVW